MRDLVLEDFLKQQGHEFEYLKEMPLDGIQVENAARENIRLDQPMNDATVNRYTLAVEQGAHFPALLLYRLKNGAFGVVNGLHRYVAYKACKLEVADAYVLHTQDPRAIELLQRTTNTVTTGEPPSEEERVEHAVRLTIGLNYKPVDAAALMQVRPDRVWSRIAFEKAAGVLAKHKVQVPTRISQTAISRMHAASREPHFIKMVKVAASARLSSDRCMKMADDVKRAPSDAVAIKIIHQWEATVSDERVRTAGGRVTDPARAYIKLMRTLTKTWEDLRSLKNFPSITSRDGERAVTLIENVRKELDTCEGRFRKFV